MSEIIELPLWLVAVAGALAAWALADRFLLPSVRWFFRRRVNRVVAEINTRLDLKIQTFKLTKRRVLIDRLIFDVEVMRAVEEKSAETGVPREVLMDQVTRHAGEIVPAFNAYLYFRFGAWAARRLAEWLYRVRLGYADDKGLAGIAPDTSVIFVMNHRSNMDYVLVAYLAASRTALSYAVGEWARIWPLQALIRSLGAYFIRRNSGDQLYRRVLERYVAMATAGGVVQAVYPEGGLSKDGKLRPPRLGLLNYMLKALDSDMAQDIVFVPVGINYDRVLEDRSLVRSLDAELPRRSMGYALKTTFGFIGHNFSLMLRGKWYRFGYASVNFGAPVSAREWLSGIGDAGATGEAGHRQRVELLGQHLMERVGQVVPVLPVSLIASVFVRDPALNWNELDLKVAAHGLMTDLESRGVHVYVPREDRDYALSVGIRMLSLRRLISEIDGVFQIAEGELAMLTYYANGIVHHFDAAKKTARNDRAVSNSVET